MLKLDLLYDATSPEEVFGTVQSVIHFLRSNAYLVKLPDRYRNIAGDNRAAIEVWYRRLSDDAETDPNVRLTGLRDFFQNAINTLRDLETAERL